MGIMDNCTDTAIHINIKAHKETISGLLHGTRCINTEIDIDFIQDLIDIIENRLLEIQQMTVCDGYLSLQSVRLFNEEVNRLEKHLLKLRRIASITEL